MAQVRIRARPGGQQVDEAAIRRIATGPGVRRDLNRRATKVAAFVRVSVPMRTGALRSSVRIEESVGASGARVAVLMGRGVPHAGPYIFGARPHRIEPRRAQVLRFVVGGQVVFARSVQHPGNKPLGLRILRESTRFWKP